MRAIYAIKCVDGRHYVGSTTRTKVRWSKHRSLLRLGRHSNTPLQTAWTQLGEAAFSFVILELVPEGEGFARVGLVGGTIGRGRFRGVGGIRLEIGNVVVAKRRAVQSVEALGRGIGFH